MDNMGVIFRIFLSIFHKIILSCLYGRVQKEKYVNFHKGRGVKLIPYFFRPYFRAGGREGSAKVWKFPFIFLDPSLSFAFFCQHPPMIAREASIHQS